MAELKEREERLEDRELDIIRRERLLTEKTSAIDERDRNINKLAENARTELHRVVEAKIALDNRKETIVAVWTSFGRCCISHPTVRRVAA